MRRLLGLAVLALAGCGGAARPKPLPALVVRPASQTPNLPDFVARSYEPFSRSAAVAIALREWRLFGQVVDDDPPGTRRPPPPDDKPERVTGLWQRVGEYWFLGQDSGRMEASWTGKHTANGDPFPASEDGDFAWSAAFVSYVMRIAGAGTHFPYSPAHHDYIDAARQVSLGQASGWDVSAQPPDGYAPVAGDLICTSRTRKPLRFDDLPAGVFAAHCDIVVTVAPGTLSVIGGNVDDAVTMKHVPVTTEGKLAPPGGTVLDDRYPWFVVLKVLYEAE